MSSSEELKQKLQKVLALFLTQDYSIVTPTYLELLHTHVVGEIKNGNREIFQVVQNWLIHALNTWDDKFKPCQNVATFTIKLLGSLSIEEPAFAHLNQNNVYNKACQIFELERTDLPASVKMAFTLMFVNFLEHQSGRSWITATGSWKVLLRFAQLNHTMYVTKESQKFLATFLLRECYNRSLCEEIIVAVAKPLVDATLDPEVHNQQPPTYTLDKHVLFDKDDLLLMTLELLLVIIDTAAFHDLTNPIPSMFEELTSLTSRVNVVFEVSISTPLMKTVHKLSKLLVFTPLRESMKTSDNLDEKHFEQFCLGLCYTSTLLLSKKYILDLVISKKLGIIYWKKLNKLKNIEAPKPYKFEDQGITLMILPFCVTLKPSYMKEHYLFEEFIDKLFAVTCTPVQRLAYNTRDVIWKNDLPMEPICKAAVDHILEIVDILDRESAVIVFQCFCHSLKNFVVESCYKNKETQQHAQNMESGEPTSCPVPPNKKRPTYRYLLDGDPINEKPLLLAALLNGMNVLTEKFKLKWQECVETICVLAIAQDILNHPGVDSKICMLALKSCKLAIENFMPPNLALLVDFDDHTREIGPTLYKRIHDPNWEVQDSVLEILNTVACLSQNKYPPYQCLILENNFLKVAVDIITSETESYVRASALVFISTAVRIKTLWEKSLNQMNLPAIAIKLVYQENEAIVRREAVALIRELYVHREWQKPMIATMVQAMTTAAVLDLHWEVKINALEFWREFIDSHLSDQGMLDGHFPNVTFSKEHRKIVSLNENEIKQRLNKALDELSRQNCLGVLLVTLKDDSDFEVSKTAAGIISVLRRTLLDYKLHEPMPEPLLPKDSAIIDTNYIKRPEVKKGKDGETANNANVIIDEIIESTDANLLASIYRDSMRMDGDDTERTRKETFDYISKVTRQEFLGSILDFDLDGYIKERQEWLKNYTTSFDSILDDIMAVNERKDINIMDCY